MTSITPANLSSSRNDWYPGAPLDTERREIRLLRLQPAHSFDDEIHVELETTQLRDRWTSRYEALSYAWGGYAENREIHLNGRPGFKVTDNLFYALRRLRRRHARRIIWADAVCVNQNNDDERGTQVVLMGQIYSRASWVLIWLGESERPLHINGKRTIRSGWGNEDDFKNVSRISSQDKTLDRFSHLIRALTLTEPFWGSRAWIIQEAALARRITVLFGPCASNRFFHVPLANAKDRFDEDLDHYTGLCQLHTPHLSAVFRDIREAVCDIYKIRMEVSCGPPSLPRLMAMTSHSRAKVSHDKLYSLLPMTEKRFADLCTPNYKESAVAAFTKATYAQIDFAQRLEILSQVRISQEGHDSNVAALSSEAATETWPSWAVDFETPTHDMSLQGAGARMKPSPWEMDGRTCLIDNKILSITGFALDTVHTFTGYYASSVEQNDIDRDLWTVAVGAFDRCYDQNPTDVFDRKASRARAVDYAAWKGQTFEAWKEAYFATAPYSFTLCSIFHHWDKLFGAIYHDDQKSSTFWFEHFPKLYKAHKRYVDYAGKGASLFATTGGFLGMGVRGLRYGDEIVQLNGTTWPIVLRRVQGSEDYTFRGFAFVPGTCDYSGLRPLFPKDLEKHLRTYRIQ